MKAKLTDRWATPPDDFHFILFEQVNPAKNEARFYYLAWQPTLTDSGAVVRVYGRKWGWQRVLVTPFPSLTEAWPSALREPPLILAVLFSTPMTTCGSSWQPHGPSTGIVLLTSMKK